MARRFSQTLIGTNRTLDATSQQTSQEAVKDVVSLRIRDHMIANTLMEKRQVAKPSASTIVRRRRIPNRIALIRTKLSRSCGLQHKLHRDLNSFSQVKIGTQKWNSTSSLEKSPRTRSTLRAIADTKHNLVAKTSGHRKG